MKETRLQQKDPEDPERESPASPSVPDARAAKSAGGRAAKFPGVAAIALWLLFEALIGVVGVFTRHFSSHAARLTVLGVSTLLAVASLGLLRMKRWGWALALGAAFLTSTYGIYIILRYHQQNYWVMTIVNFVFFFYLVRPEILRRLR